MKLIFEMGKNLKKKSNLKKKIYPKSSGHFDVKILKNISPGVNKWTIKLHLCVCERL